MAIFRWGHSWETFHDLESEMDRLLQTVNFAFHGIRLGRQFPAVNVYELPDEYLLTAEVAGMKAEDLEVTIEEGLLTLKGKRVDPDCVPEERYRRQERFRGTWQRSVSVPERVNSDGLTAEIVDGILRVHLPKGKQEQPRRILVTEGTD